MLPLEGGRRPHQYEPGGGTQAFAQLSPDGRWIAFGAGPREGIYVQSFPSPGGGKWLLTATGNMVRWRSDQKEMYYLAADGNLMSVPVSGWPTPSFGPAKALFAARMLPFGPNTRQQYDVTADGQKFLVNLPIVEPSVSPITVVLNWQEELNQLAPTR